MNFNNNKYSVYTGTIKIPIDTSRDIFCSDPLVTAYLMLYGFVPVSMVKDKFNPKGRVFYFMNNEDTINSIIDITEQIIKQEDK